MRITADAIIKAGFWVQVMLLVLVDAGSLATFLRAPRTQHSALPPVGPQEPEG